MNIYKQTIQSRFDDTLIYFSVTHYITNVMACLVVNLQRRYGGVVLGLRCTDLILRRAESERHVYCHLAIWRGVPYTGSHTSPSERLPTKRNIYNLSDLRLQSAVNKLYLSFHYQRCINKCARWYVFMYVCVYTH